MSDYSPPPSPNAFDELEDLLYDADPAPDLADELASHALHSPLLYAAEYEPGYDLQEYYSDWEYYSDDYYDDDPSILKKIPIDGSPIKNTRHIHESAKSGRSRKRKLADSDNDVPALADDRRYLENCMKGTVWAQPIPMRDNIYRVGQGEKVALLKDWRTKFGTASPKKGQRQSKPKPTLSKDESWANDLSLADMGLLNARGSMAQAAEGKDEDGDAGEGDEHEDEEYEDGELGEDEIIAMEDELNEAEDAGPTVPAEARPSPFAVRSRQASSEADNADIEEQPNKRRKRETAPSAPALPSPPATNGSTASLNTRRTRNRADSASTAASATTAKFSKQQKPPPAPESRASRKRKASPADEEDREDSSLPKSRATVPTASSRAKRVASTAHNVVSDKSKIFTQSGPARATRSRKK